MRPLPEVEVMLDDRRHTFTRADGTYRFLHVPRGRHKIEVVYRSREPFFFTTAADLEVDQDDTVNFGIGYALSGLMGQVLNDAGQGVAEVTIAIRSRGQRWTAATDANGSFFVSSLVAGDYDVEVDEDSLPAGFSTDPPVQPQKVRVEARSPGKASFTARALRSISGRVLGYDSKAGRYAPVPGAQVILRESGLTAITDRQGRYLFRDLPTGSYTISVQSGVHTSTHTVRLGAQPVDFVDADFQVTGQFEPTAPLPNFK
jgi:hypothetical protein